MERFIIGDLHLGHKNIIEYCSRPFVDVDDMNISLISNWNSVITKTDKVYVNGDVCINKKYLSLLNEMNGKKILIPGNHDIFEAKEYFKYFDDIRGYMVRNNVIFSHIPIYKSEIERFQGNIHAHFHEQRVMINDKIHPFYYSTSVEQINYTPLSFDLVFENLKSQQNEN